MATFTRRSARRNPLLRLLSLEARDVPAVYTVNDITNTGAGSGLFGDLLYCLTQANAISTNDEIVFSSALSSATITLTGTLPAISGSQGSLKIDGSGMSGMTISGAKSVRVFNIASGGNVTINNLAIADGAKGNGAGILATAATLTMSNCDFTGNTADSDGGGLALFSNSTASLSSCRFGTNESSANGGAIFIEDGTVSLLSCSIGFNNGTTNLVNHAKSGGGGVYVADGIVTISPGTQFQANTADTGAGLYCAGGTTKVYNSAFTSNVASGSGGGIYTAGSTLRLTDCAITSNTALGDGGGIAAVNNSTVILTSGSVESNSAVGNGGGIHASMTALIIDTNSAGAQCNLNFNTATSGNGGAIHSVGGGSLKITNARLTVNVAGNTTVGTSSGGAIHSETSTQLNDCKIFNNSADFGGGVNIESLNGSLDLNHSDIGQKQPGGNKAKVEGGCLRMSGVSTTVTSTIRNGSVISEGEAELRGGNIAIVGGGAITIDDTEISSAEVFDPINGMGGGFYIGDFAGSNSALSVTNCLIGIHAIGMNDGNYAHFGGNIAIVDLATSVSFENCNILVSEPSPLVDVFRGGGVYITGTTGGTVLLAKNTIGPHFTEFGAGIDLIDTNTAVTVDSCTISGNTATQVGGGIAITNSTSTVIIDSCTLSTNGASMFGGGIAIDASPNVTVINSTISNNTAGMFGGGLYFPNGGSNEIVNSTIFGNTSVEGGGVYFNGVNGQADNPKFYNCTIAYNDASPAGSGGGLRFQTFGITDIVLLDSTLVAKNTTTSGGGPDLYVNKGVTSDKLVEAHFSLIGVGDQGFGLSVNDTNELGIGTPLDPKFITGMLADNGGPTLTLAIAADSPATDAGRNEHMPPLAFDQRGTGFLREVKRLAATTQPTADMGAYEIQLPLTAEVDVPGTQRSMVTSIVITFSETVTFAGAPVDAFELTRTSFIALYNSSGGFFNDSDLGTVLLSAATSVVGNKTQVVLTFLSDTITGNGIIDTSNSGTSLQDGRYNLQVFADQVTGDLGNLFDYNNVGASGQPGLPATGDDLLIVGSTTNAPKLFRFFGDSDGDGDVDITDFMAFRNAMGIPSTVFDYDEDILVDNADFAAFKARFQVAF